MGRALSVIGVPTGAGPYSAALEGLTALNEYILRANPQTPRLYESGVRYTKDSTDTWRDLTKVLASKTGDCEALSTWRTAELRVSGEDPNASVIVYKTGPTKFHAIVLRGDGSLEDPSVELGMKPPSGLLDAYASWNSAIEAAPQQEARPMVMGADDDVACAVIGANNAPHDGEVVFDVIGTGEGFKGAIRIPLHDGRAIYATTSTSATKDEAAKKAHRVLGVIGSFWDDLAILVPSTQAQAAIRLAKNEHVQNLAKDAYQAGKRAIGRGDNKKKGPTRNTSLISFLNRQAAADAAAPAQADYIPPGGDLDADMGPDPGAAEAPLYFDEGQGEGPYDEHGAFAPTDAVMGWDLFEMNGVLCGGAEVECLGHINEAMARMSTPRTVVGAARSRAPARGGGGGGRGGARGGAAGGRSATPAAFGGPQMYQGGRPQTFQPFPGSPGAPVSPFGGPTPFGAPTPFYSGSSPYGGPPPGVNPSSAAAMALYQRQQNMLKSQMLQQSGGSGGGGGGGGYGGDGGGYGGDYTQSDAAADAQGDADLWNAYYGNQALEQAQQQYFDTAQETSADQFFGAVDPYTAEAMLQDDSIPAQ